MTFEEELEMFKSKLKQANSIFNVALRYFREYLGEMPIDGNKFKYDQNFDLLIAAAHIVFEVDLDLGGLLSRLKETDEDESA